METSSVVASVETSSVVASVETSSVVASVETSSVVASVETSSVVASGLEMSQISAISWREHITFRWDDNEVRFVVDQHA
jgi:hypothetical protein